MDERSSFNSTQPREGEQCHGGESWHRFKLAISSPPRGPSQTPDQIFQSEYLTRILTFGGFSAHLRDTQNLVPSNWIRHCNYAGFAKIDFHTISPLERNEPLERLRARVCRVYVSSKVFPSVSKRYLPSRKFVSNVQFKIIEEGACWILVQFRL